MSGAPSRRQHKQFCETERWTPVKNARGKAVGHHITLELALADGRILRTRISRPANNDRYGSALWSHILTTQLDVTAEQFWACIDKGVLPPRPLPAPAVPESALPASLVYQLLHTVGMSDAQVATLSKPEAIRMMNDYWSGKPG